MIQVNEVSRQSNTRNTVKDSDGVSNIPFLGESDSFPAQMSCLPICGGGDANSSLEAAQQEWRARVFFQGHCCTLVYSAIVDKVFILREASGGSDSSKVLLQIPMNAFLNVESLKERIFRQNIRGVSDYTIQQVNYIGCLSDTYSLLNFIGFSTFPINPDTEATLFSSLDVNSPAAVSGNKNVCSFHNTQLGMSLHSQDASSIVSNENPSPPQPRDKFLEGIVEESSDIMSASSTVGFSRIFFLHYVNMKRSSRDALRTVVVSFVDDAQSQGATPVLIEAMLRRIYRQGPKNILFFISPKSGRGRGVDIYENKVKPFLHFTRHRIEAKITSCAHECENYVANMRNSLTKDDVVVVVGGDGMMHELLNGLHRRKLSLIAEMRKESRDVLSQQQPQPPPSAVIHTSDALGHSAHVQTESDTTEKDPSKMLPCSSTLSSRPVGSTHVTFNANSPGARQTPVTDLFLCGGWDALLPMTSIVPSGSACGLSMTLGVQSSIKATLALVHLNNCSMDLLNLSFIPNDDLIASHWWSWSSKKRANAARRYKAYCKEYDRELGNHALGGVSFSLNPYDNSEGNGTHSREGSNSLLVSGSLASAGKDVAVPSSPFLENGTALYTNAVSHHIGAPHTTHRVAFMSLSFGVINDIDRGSEHLRWMGSARFFVYGGVILLKGIRKYRAVIRYLPWVNRKGLTLKKISKIDTLPSRLHFPNCTMRSGCSHCAQYAPVNPIDAATAWSHASNIEKMPKRGVSGLNDAVDESNELQREEADCKGAWEEGSRDSASGAPHHAAAASPMSSSSSHALCRYNFIASCSEADLLQENAVDFDCKDLPWETVSGEFYNIILCNIPDVARDMVMAPLSHLSDGAIDIIFVRYSALDMSNTIGGRKKFIQFFTSLEKGEHVNYPFTSYVKARAVEIKVDSGILMSDGEMMPLRSVRLTKLRNGVRMVCFDP